MANTQEKQVVAADPLTAFEVAWLELQHTKRLRTLAGGAVFATAFLASAYIGEADPRVLLDGLPDLLNYLSDITPTIRAEHIVEDVTEWYWGLGSWLGLLLDTVLIAFLGTLLGTIGAFALCFPASHNLMRAYSVYFVSRRIAEIARAVPELVYAMIFVFAFGLGPFAGVLAIAIHTAGALGKLFAEVNENVDQKPVEGVYAAGANWFQMIRYAVLPQVLPNYASYTLLRFEINVRGAAVIGFVGAGGIGQELMFVIRQFIYADISAIVVLIILTVSIIDISCERVRHHLIGRESML